MQESKLPRSKSNYQRKWQQCLLPSTCWPLKHITFSSPPPPIELKPLPSHLKYAYLDTEQQLLEQEDKFLHVLRQHKKAIGWKLSDLPSINPSICMHRILMEEEACSIRKQQRRLIRPS
ncbi:hypothetical protein CR513_25344, partial [Mucuna pruriens]